MENATENPLSTIELKQTRKDEEEESKISSADAAAPHVGADLEPGQITQTVAPIGAGEEGDSTDYELSIYIVAMLRMSTKFAPTSSIICPNAKLEQLWIRLSAVGPSATVTLFQSLCLMALALSVSFSYCTTPSDCKLGQVCVDYDGKLPTCEDCLYAEEELGGSYAVAGGYNPDSYHNISDYCQKTLKGELDNDDRVAEFLGVGEYGETCLYLKQNSHRAGTLDAIVRVGAFILLSCMCAKERQRQLVGEYVRLKSYPFSPRNFNGSWLEIMDGIVVFIVWKAQGIFRDKVLLTVLPFTMILLLANYGFGSLDTIVNGLSIGFMLEFDTLCLAVFVSGAAAAKRTRQLAEIFGDVQAGGNKHFHAYCLRRSFIRGVIVFTYLSISFKTLFNFGNCQTLFIETWAYANFLFVPLAAVTEELLVPAPLDINGGVSNNERAKMIILKWVHVLLDILVGVYLFYGVYVWANGLFYE